MHSPRLIVTVFFVAMSAVCQPPAVHPSNGVLELSATPLPNHDPRPAGMRVEQYVPWRGIVEVTIRNISIAPIEIEEQHQCELGFSVFDSAGRPVEQTESGKQCAELFRTIGPPMPVIRFTRRHLEPMQGAVYSVGLSEFFKIEPGHGYTVVIRRSHGLPKVDELGRQLKEVEVSCSFEVPEYGVPRVRRRR